MDLICGINPVLEALAAGTRHFDRLLIVKGLRNRRVSEAIRRATQLGIPLRFETRETIDRRSGGIPHQGIIAVVSAKAALSLDTLLESTRTPALLVVLDGVEDPRNLGAILRTAEAAGVDGVVLPERHSAGLSETVARASAGALEHVRVARVGNLVQALTALKTRGVWAIGFDAQGGERWDAVDLCRPVALVLGGEGRGMRRLVREHCDQLVSIPHFGQVSSLNVSVAAGIALYEAIRQRRAVPSPVRPIPIAPVPPLQVVGPRPDDPETDPGALYPAPPAEMAASDSVDLMPRAHVDIQEDVAWGSGPTVLKPAGFDRGSRWRGRRRWKGAPRPAEGLRPSAGGGAGGESQEPSRRRRRRRRRARDGGDPARAAGPGGGSGEDGASGGVGPEGAAAGGQGPPSGGPPREPGDRRGRRRRGRHR